MSSSQYLYLMQDWIQEQYPANEHISYNRLREVVRASWDGLPERFLKDLIETMQARCQAINKALIPQPRIKFQS